MKKLLVLAFGLVLSMQSFASGGATAPLTKKPLKLDVEMINSTNDEASFDCCMGSTQSYWSGWSLTTASCVICDATCGFAYARAINCANASARDAFNRTQYLIADAP